MKRRTFIETAGLTALSSCLPGSIGQVLPAQTAESRLPATGPLSGRRILTFNSVIRVNQIEVARTRNDGFDEYDRHTPENIKALRAAFAADKAGVVSSQSQGLHGYIGFSHDQPPAGSGYSAGMGFYAAVWPLIDQPLADFQIGLPSSWVTPDNSDNKDQPLAPGGTLARTWKERGCP